MVHDPEAGAWTAVVDGFRIPSGGVEADYMDVIIHDAFGVLRSGGPSGQRASGGNWRAEGELEIAAHPIAPRSLVAIVEVTADSVFAIRSRRRDVPFDSIYGAFEATPKRAAVGRVVVTIDRPVPSNTMSPAQETSSVRETILLRFLARR